MKKIKLIWLIVFLVNIIAIYLTMLFSWMAFYNSTGTFLENFLWFHIFKISLPISILSCIAGLIFDIRHRLINQESFIKPIIFYIIFVLLILGLWYGAYLYSGAFY